MKKIGIISDTHNHLPVSVAEHFADCDEIWHAGDWGSIRILDQLNNLFSSRPTPPLIRGVYGNIDGKDISTLFPENLFFTCESVSVFIRHIGGYPGRYAPGVKSKIQEAKSKLFISGHSHILKIMYDPALECLHINPGAAGKQGWHQVQTLVKLVIDGSDMRDCQVIELAD
jgi:putative phosphoesterase